MKHHKGRIITKEMGGSRGEGGGLGKNETKFMQAIQDVWMSGLLCEHQQLNNTSLQFTPTDSKAHGQN